MSQLYKLFTVEINPKGVDHSLLKKVWDRVLSKEFYSHVLFEPNIVIRTNNPNQVRCYFAYEDVLAIYSYPDSNGQGYDESNSPIVRENLDLFLPLFHFHSRAYFDFSYRQYYRYSLIDKLLEHTKHVPSPVLALQWLAELKLGYRLKCTNIPVKPRPIVYYLDFQVESLIRKAKRRFTTGEYLQFVERNIHVVYNTQQLSSYTEGIELQEKAEYLLGFYLEQDLSSCQKGVEKRFSKRFPSGSGSCILL